MNYLELSRLYLDDVSLDSPQTLADAVGICGSIMGLWGIHDITPARLRRFQSKAARAKAYVDFEIPKKSGGVRRISSPVAALKELQRALGLMLQTLCEVAPEATGFVAGCSVVDNAVIHAGQRVVFNCDLKDFFTSITKPMVRKAMASALNNYGASREVVNLISSLVTAPLPDGLEVLPQGAPTSPAVSNIVMRSLDRRLAGFAEANGYRYSRYADDITFSHSHGDGRMHPDKIAAIFSIIKQSGLTVNPRKTKTYTRAERMEVTGLTVGDKVNVARSYIKQLRTLLHLWESRGYAEARLIYSRDFRGGADIDIAKVINGKINYLAMVKGRDDSVYRRMKRRYRRLVKAITTAPASPSACDGLVKSGD